MKKIICIFLICVITCGLVACNKNKGTKESNNEESNITEVNIDYSAAISSIAKAMESIHECAAVQQNWLGVSNNLPYLYSDSNYEGGNNDNAKSAGRQCYLFRKGARNELEKAKTIIKGGSGDLHSAVQKYYLAVSECMSFVSNFPEGYTKITWYNKWTELEQKVNSAAAEVELYK